MNICIVEYTFVKKSRVCNLATLDPTQCSDMHLPWPWGTQSQIAALAMKICDKKPLIATKIQDFCRKWRFFVVNFRRQNYNLAL